MSFVSVAFATLFLVVVLVDVCGRIWDTVQLAMHSGVDVPLLSFRIAMGERPTPSDAWPRPVRV